MSTLADELMDDLLGDSGSDAGSDGEAGPSTVAGGGDSEILTSVKEEGDSDDEMVDVKMELDENGDMAIPEGGVRPAAELDPELVKGMEMSAVESVGKVAKLASGKVLKEVLSKIDFYKVNPDANLASDADSKEYALIVQANNLSVEIDNEMLLVHKFLRDHYLPRFPELDSLVSTPLPFCRVILALGNQPELRGDIAGILPSGAVMGVTVMAATSKGEPLEAREWRVVEEGCETMFKLEEGKVKILEYVESRISLLAPNISAIVGTTTATKILGISGGLQGLSRIPHSNIYLLGATKRPSTGFSTSSHSIDRRHTGFIYACPLVQSLPLEFRMKGQRKVGAKVALAVRVDIAGSREDGGFGEEMVEKLEKEFERLTRPSLLKVTKALPRPDEKKKNRRGGKRARKAKEATAQTELSKMQNRMKFGEAEEETGAYDETVGLGMIGSSSGKIRANAGEARSKAKMSKMNKNRLASFAKSSSSSGLATSGLATSLSFTPVQGLELIDPSKARAAAAAKANESWFAEGTFTHVRKEKGFGKNAD